MRTLQARAALLSLALAVDAAQLSSQAGLTRYGRGLQATVTPSAYPTPDCAVFNGVPIRAGVGASGSFAARVPRPVTSAWSAASTCPGGSLATIYAAPTGTDLYSIDLSGLPLGGSLTVSSCYNPTFPLTAGATGDNALYVFRRCPANNLPLSWGCAASNDQGGNVPYVCSGLAQVTLNNTNQSSYYVAVAQWSASAWTAGMWWDYVLPTPTTSPTASSTASPTASLSVNAPVSATHSATITASATVTATGTATASPTVAPTCGATALNGVPIRAGVGASGSFAARAPRPALSAWSAASTCPGGALATIYAAPTGTDLYSIDLSRLPLGGSLTVSSCINPIFPLTAGATGDNALYVFRRCPANNLPLSWGCVASNDEGGNVPYVCTNLAQVTLVTNQSVYFVAVAQFNTAAWASGLWWNYVLPTPTSSATATLSLGASASASSAPTPEGTSTPSGCAAAVGATFKGVLSGASGVTGLTTLLANEISPYTATYIYCAENNRFTNNENFVKPKHIYQFNRPREKLPHQLRC